MVDANPQAAVSALEKLDDNHLLAELGKRLNAIEFAPHLSAQFDLTVPSLVEAQGTFEDFRAFGSRFFSRINRQAYELICGSDPADKEARDKLVSSIGLGQETLAATLSTLIVGQLGLAPAVAAVVAILIVRLCFRPALGAMCDVWKGKLGPAQAST